VKQNHDYKKLHSETATFVLTPTDIRMLVQRLPDPARVVVLVMAATGIPISDCLALKWKGVDWTNQAMYVQLTIGRGETQSQPMLKVPICEAFAELLKRWRQRTPYDGEGDYIFASAKQQGRQPLAAKTLSSKFVKPAAVALG